MIEMYGAAWCGDCRRTKALLETLGVSFVYHDVEQDVVLRDKAVAISGVQSIPVVVFPDGTHVVEPSNPAMQAKLTELGLLA